MFQIFFFEFAPDNKFIEPQVREFLNPLTMANFSASLSHVSCPLGCLLGGPLLDRFGRCRSMQLLNIPNIIGWLLLTLVPAPFQSVYPLFMGRLLTGFAAGLATCASATYIAEVVTLDLRTLLVSLAPVMMGVGIFTIYLLAFLFQVTLYTIHNNID